MVDNVSPMYGRPPSDDPSEKTKQNQFTAERSAMKELAEQLHLPMHLRFDPAEESDIARMIHYGQERLRNMQRLPVVFYNGAWHIPNKARDGGRYFVGAVGALNEWAREQAVRDTCR